MERLLLLDSENYTDDMAEITRIAVRGIIFVDGKLLLIEDNRNEVKLPGGGQEEGETDIETLIREVREETGCTVITETVRPFGYIEEKRKSIHENMIWHHFSRLYFCDVTDERSGTEYSENEKKHGMQFRMYTIDEAIARNRAMLNNIGELIWNQREYRTLLLIKEYMEKGVIIGEENMLLPQTDNLINGFVERSNAILQDNLVGVYLHGSSVMGCFNPQKSDIDLIVVVERPLPDPIKKEYLDMVVRYNAMGPAKGIEMSIVLRKVCKPFVYPTPYELHFSDGHLDSYTADPDGYFSRMKGVDRDLAAHFTIINRRGKCLCGAPIEKVFAQVPGSDYLDSILYDVEGAAEEIAEHPMYLTLNLARVLAYKEEKLVLSKKEGGDWALRHLPSEYHPLIMDAMREYSENAEVVYDGTLAKRYAEYVLGQITQ